MKLFLKSTTSTTAFFFIICSLNILLATDKVSARPNKCEQIRRVRHLAWQENLDGQNLAKLESLYCDRPDQISPELNLPPENASKDCINLTVMKRLAKMTISNSNFISTIEGQRKTTCQVSQQNSSFNWFNGKTAKLGSSWYYPNGEKANFASNWDYPNGKTAKFGSSWYYPNGETANFASSWYYPNGKTASLNSLLGWACGVVGTKECDYATARLEQTEGFWYELEVLDLSWKAYQITQSR